MRKILINYADDAFKKAQKKNSESGIAIGGFDQCISYGPKDIGSDFAKKNKKILSQKRGAGYWLWKPYIIQKTLELLAYGDFLFYCDSGSHFIGSIDPLIDISTQRSQDVIVFDLEHIEKRWTKRDAFVLLGCDEEKYKETMQRIGGFVLIKKTDRSLSFFDEYLRYAQDERILTDQVNSCGENYPGFVEHRHDQSILSLLSKKHGLESYRDPSQWGNKMMPEYENSSYGQLVELTRKTARSDRFRKMIKGWIGMV
ncbi:hypothetical protein [Desulfotalea psychrophila]|uniref:Uncharacterized protein n=1 Tax=Desulfotalea psychrophila (strain LSv54 / DSM 12343) TaxID=177439 RepID=Q6ASB6_DESPS|nr:hypothetical protein [Desulfotalea psychrophila]CAG34747.1 hypothetical protein DP0018 [Desulfotalea psychrophila LSv54]